MSTIDWLVLSAVILALVVICVVVLASLRMASKYDKEAKKAFEEEFGGEE